MMMRMLLIKQGRPKVKYTTTLTRSVKAVCYDR